MTPEAIAVGAGVAAVGAATATSAAVGLGENLAQIKNNQNGSSEKQSQRRYVPSPKHNPQGGWGSPMDLSDDVAGQVLNEGISNGKQVYGYHEGKVYVFQPDNAGGFHGYNITGNERIPTTVLRQWKDDGIISSVEYSHMLKWSP